MENLLLGTMYTNLAAVWHRDDESEDPFVLGFYTWLPNKLAEPCLRSQDRDVFRLVTDGERFRWEKM